MSAQQAIADQNGFRLANGYAGSWLGKQRGVSPRAPNSLSLRDGAVLAAELKAWDGLRRPVAEILLNRAADAKELDDAIIHLQDALTGYQPQDRSWWPPLQPTWVPRIHSWWSDR